MPISLGAAGTPSSVSAWCTCSRAGSSDASPCRSSSGRSGGVTSASQDRSALRSSARSSRTRSWSRCGEGAADGAAQLRDPVLQGVECFLHDSRPYQRFQSFPDNSRVSVYGVAASPLMRRAAAVHERGETC